MPNAIKANETVVTVHSESENISSESPRNLQGKCLARRDRTRLWDFLSLLNPYANSLADRRQAHE